MLMKAAFRQFIARIFERQVRRLIRRHRLKVVAVAGSVGKTSSRMAVATVLRTKYSVQNMSHPGYNSEIGLPLSVFDLSVPGLLMNPFAWIWRLIKTEQIIHSRYPHQVLVLELGTDHPGEMARYLRYLSPDIGVMTAVTPEHMENFPSLNDVAAEELLLAAASKQFVASKDDVPAKYREHYIDSHPNHHYYGIGRDTEYGFTVASTDPIGGTVGELFHSGHVAIKELHLGVYGVHSAKTALAAYAVGDLLGLTPSELAEGLDKVRPVAGRMNVLPGVNGSTIIDDTYNSSPEAVTAALKALAQIPTGGRRIAILGSMNELGVKSPEYHAASGAEAASLDLLVTVGEMANRYLGPAALREGLDPTRYKPADSPYAAGEYLALILRPGDVLLAKGSQNGVFAEEALKLLLASPADRHKLVRQSDSWLRAKAKQFPNPAGRY
jgi:UDP-N-acetylmuramoyl-tripeptide--D-alanyl-D-alanine ligase